MEFRILGPLEVDDSSGSPVRLPAGRERALLVALLLRRGEVVSVDALVDALWDERAPSTAAKAVQGYVSHLRRLLGDDAGALLTRAPGYVLQIEAAQVDAARFERLAADGQRALEDGDPAGALATLDTALGLWRGPALPEFAFDDFAQREIQRLTDRQLEATEDRVDALLQLDRHRGVVSELDSLVAAHPLRERLRGQLMLALYRAGRPADALQAFKEGARLSRELGLDPAPELRQLERAILEQDPGIAAPRVEVAPAVARELPTGTATLLSSDIESSTGFLRAVGAETWGEILSRHRVLMREAFARHGGSEVDTQGDAFFVSFARAADAVHAAVAAQHAHLAERWPGGVAVRARIGLHTGAPETSEARYVWLDVHRVARVASEAHGGEILCTASTAALLDPDEHQGIRLVDLGEFPLKDFPRPVRLLRVVADGLPDWSPAPSVPRPRPRLTRRRLLLAAVALATVGAIALDRVTGDEAPVTVVPPAVAVIDPETNRVVATFETGSRPVTIAAGAGAVWVGDASDGTVTRIDPVARHIVRTIGVGAPVVDLAVGAGGVWAATGGFGEVLRIDPDVNAVADRFPLGEPGDVVVPAVSAIAAGGEGVWVGAFDGLVRIDRADGDIADRVDLGRTPAQAVEVGHGAVWATIISGRAKRVEASSAVETTEFYAGTSVYPVAVDGEGVWVGGGGFSGGHVWELDPVTATTVGTVSFASPVEAIGLDADSVWVALVEEPTIVRVDRETRAPVETISIAGLGSEIAVDSGLVWVAVRVPDEG